MAKAPQLTQYQTVYNVKHDGKRYKPGSTVEMTPEQAEPLVRRGTLVEIGNPPVKPNADMADPTAGGYKEPDNLAKIITKDAGEV